MFAVACTVIAWMIVASALVVAILDWAGHLPLAERLALNSIAAGLLWASPAWFQQHRPPSLGDLLFLGGVGLLMTVLYGRAIRQHFGFLSQHEHGLVKWGQPR